MFNQIISLQTQFFLLQTHLPITVSDISQLISEALTDCQPIRISELSAQVLLAPSEITHCLIVINFASHSSVEDIETVRVICLTSWGELYSFSELGSFYKIRRLIANQTQTPACRLFTPVRNKRRILYPLVEAMTDFVFEKVGLGEPQEQNNDSVKGVKKPTLARGIPELKVKQVAKR